MASVTVQVVQCGNETPIPGATITPYGLGSSNSEGKISCSWPDADGTEVTALVECASFETHQIYLSETAGGPLRECMSPTGSSNSQATGWTVSTLT
jgi:hypothetical protein